MVKALICGGGNGAHVMAATAANQPDVEARVLTLYANEAEEWTKNMEEAGGLTIVDTTGPEEKLITAKPAIVSKNPEAVAPGVDIILFAVPAFAHEQYLNALKPYVQPGTIVVGIPGQAGFDFAIRGAWGDLAKQCTMMNFLTLPWNCRLIDFGKRVSVMSVKVELPGALLLSTPPPANDPLAIAQSVLGARPKLITKGHITGISLSPSNPILHPTIMYGTWSKWDGKPMDTQPLFYNDLSQDDANLLAACSEEVVNTAKALMEQRPQVDLTNVDYAYDYYTKLLSDQIEDKTSLYTVLRTCSGFKGLTHPMIQTPEGKYLPNFKFRYLMEDIPCGMAVIRGIATIAGVPTPNLDKVLTWAQGVMGKEYLVDGKFAGKDVSGTRSPQKYGLNTVDQILGL